MNKKWIFITLILLFGVFLRIYKISSNPPGLTPDEASLGYNAYSILKTGRDEYKTPYPIIFKSFGDFKPGLYVYLTVPSVALLGLNETSVRLPSVIAGTITIYLIFLVTKELFKNSKLALIALAISAINPWLIYFSRGAWEVNIALTLTLAGIYFFLRSLKNQKSIILSSIFFALTLLDYQGAKLSTSTVLITLLALYWKKILRFRPKYLFLSIISGITISAPILISLINGQSGRLTVFSVFSYPRPADFLNNFLKEGNIQKGSLLYYLFYNEPLNFIRGIAGRFFNHFSGRFLFFEGDWSNPRHTPPYQGVLVMGDFIFLILGITYFLKDKITKEKLFVAIWMILSPLPSILSRDQVHAVRSFNLVVPLIIIISFGVYYLINNFKFIHRLPVFVIYAATFVYFLDAYFVHQPIHNSALWQYGYKQLVEEIVPLRGKYKEIKIQQSYDQPYIYFLFYGGGTDAAGKNIPYDPSRWQNQANLKLDSGPDVGHVDKMDNICFCAIDWSRDRGNHGSLIAADTKVIPPLDSSDPKEFKLIGEIKYLDGTTAWRILEIR